MDVEDIITELMAEESNDMELRREAEENSLEKRMIEEETNPSGESLRKGLFAQISNTGVFDQALYSWINGTDGNINARNC